MGNYASKNTVGWLISAIKDRFVKKEDFDSFYNDEYTLFCEYQDSIYSEEFIPLEERVTNNEELLTARALKRGALHGILTEGTGAAYTATIPEIDSLEIGLWFMMIPHTVSTSSSPTLNVNGLGAKDLRCRTSSATDKIVVATDINWLASKKPVMVTYDGSRWVVDHIRPDADNLYGVISVEQGGTGAETAEVACENLGAVKKTGDIMTGNLEFQGTDANIKINTDGNITVCPKYEYDTEYNAYHVRKPDDNEFIGSVRTVISEENNARQVGFYTLSNNGSYAHRLMIGVDDAGNRTVDVGLGATAWREAIGANNASNITTGTLALARGGTGATTAAAARTNLGAAAKSWTSLGTVTGTNSATIDLTDYSEVLIAAYYSTTYISSVVLPKALLSTSQKEVYFGGGWTSGGDRKSSAKISTTKITGVQTVVDGATVTGNYRIYAR